MSASVVIIGGGFGGLEAALTLRSLAGNAVAITLIDRSEYHSFLPSIHEVCSGKTDSRSIQIPLKTVLAPANVRFVRDAVVVVDPGNRQVKTPDKAWDYDYLIVAAGAVNHFFNIPGAEEHSLRFRSPGDAERIHGRLVSLLEDEQQSVHIVLAGGGTEGVEVAGEVLDLIEDCGRECGPDREISITVVEGRQQLLAGFPLPAGDFAQRYLRGQGVTILTGRRISEVRRGSLVLAGGEEIPLSLLIWTGGIKPSPIIEGIDLPKDDAGWLVVNDRLYSPADDRVYAVGDVAAVRGPDGPLPLQRLAYHAQDQAVVASINIFSGLRGRAMMPYTPRSKPQLVSLGRNMGIYVQSDSFRSGSWVVALKKAVERRHLMSYLTRSLFSGVARRVPGGELLRRLGLKLPF